MTKKYTTAKAAYLTLVKEQTYYRRIKQIADSPLPGMKKGRPSGKQKKFENLALGAWMKVFNAQEKWEHAVSKLSTKETVALYEEVELGHVGPVDTAVRATP